MPAATAAAFTGIHNEHEFYSHHYLSEIGNEAIRYLRDVCHHGARVDVPRSGITRR